MDKAWIKIITVTGSVGVIGFLLAIFMNHMFNEQILGLLGSERTFFIIVVVVCGLLMALITAIIVTKNNAQPVAAQNMSEPSKKVEITYDNGSTHNGDNNF